MDINSDKYAAITQPFHTSSHVEGNNPLLMFASTMNPHHLNITKVQPLAVDTRMVPRAAGQGPAMHNPSRVTSNAKPIWPVLTTTDTDRDYTVHIPSPSLSVTSNHTDCSTDFVWSSKKYILNYYRSCHANSLKCINK